MTEQDLKKLIHESEAMHQMDMAGLLFIYNKKKLLHSAPFLLSLAISFLAVVIIAVGFRDVLFSAVQSLTALNLSVFPNLLGFTIGGFALIVGFTGVGDLKKFTLKAKKENGSFYQLLVAVFSVSIFAQFCTILLSYAISFIISSHFHFQLFKFEFHNWFYAVNGIIVFVLFLFPLWSFFTIPYLVLDLFNFAQTNHSIATANRIEDELAGESHEDEVARLLKEIRDELRS